MTHMVHPGLRRSLVTAGAAALLALGTVAPSAAQAAPIASGAASLSASSSVVPLTASASLASLSLVASRGSRSSGRAAADRALSQVGSRYRYGATGTSAYDCSGLTGYAWGQAGVDIPRTSRAQANDARSISRSDLRPGDLVFFGEPVSHVEMYAGDGRLVGASRSRGRVSTSQLRYRSNISGYGRP